MPHKDYRSRNRETALLDWRDDPRNHHRWPRRSREHVPIPPEICAECARLKRHSAELLVKYTAAFDGLMLTAQSEPTYVGRRLAWAAASTYLFEAHQLEQVHQDTIHVA
jgi:hypothetical protein